MTASIIAFLCGLLLGVLMLCLYLIHMERQNQILVQATRSNAYREGYAQGYHEAATGIKHRA